MSHLSRRSERSKGFSLIELLAVLGIIGIISAIAIPSLLGSRQQARMVGDARTNLLKLQLMLEQVKADTGTYPAAGVYTWTSAGAGTRPAVDPAPTFVITGGASKLDYVLTVAANRLAYTIAATDNTLPVPVTYLVIDQFGSRVGP